MSFDLSLGNPIVGKEIVHEVIMSKYIMVITLGFMRQQPLAAASLQKSRFSGATWAGRKTVEQIVDTIDRTTEPSRLFRVDYQYRLKLSTESRFIRYR